MYIYLFVGVGALAFVSVGYKKKYDGVNSGVARFGTDRKTRNKAKM